VTTFPKAPHLVVPAMIKGAATTLAKHTQMITTLQTKAAATSALIPGAWDTITPLAGWSNVSGAVPFQARLLTTTTVQLIANLEGGTVANGTVIGQMASGFYNTVHSHTFAVTAVAGAAAVANPVEQLTVTSPGHIPVNYHAFPVVDGQIEIGAGDLGSNDTGDGDTAFSAQTTSINYNGAACTLGTDGSLTLYNVHSSVTQISFHEASLPLFTA
jgi:hypothetical protein